MLRLLPLLFTLCCLLPLLAVFGALAAFAIINWMSMCDKLVNEWAKREGLRLMQCKAQRIGSPWMLSSSARRIYRVTAERPGGDVASAWVRCGSAIAGPLNPTIEVRWN
jgi:hypothetical protein